MKRTLLASVLLAGLIIEVQAASIEAFDNATVQPGGPRTGANGKNFFNVEGSSFGNFASYGVIRFDVNGVKADFDATFGSGAWVVDSIALSLTQSNAGFTNDGAVSIYFTTDDTTSIAPGVSPLAYPFSGDFSDAQIVKGYQFTEVSSGTLETHTLYQRGGSNASGGNALAADLAGDQTITLALVDASPDVAATYAGYSNSTFAGPTLVVTAAPVPEPQTYALLLAGLGIVGWARRRIARS